VALIVEDGSGKADAESYADLAFANAYVAAQGGDATWEAAGDPAREAALRKATQYVDDVFGAQWKGFRRSAGQALRWPRQGVYDRDGYLLASDALPARLKHATAAVALEVVLGKVPFASAATTGTLASKDLQVGSLRIAKSYQGGQSTQPSIPKAEALLQDLLKPTGMPVRG